VRLPDFFIIGAPKCGTTTLYDWLGQHPEVNAPHKEPCFFSQDIFPTASLPTHIPSLHDYAEIFDFKTPTQHISGEATPKYLYSDMALNELKRLRPNAKIIVCLRNPVDLVISFHNQKLREGVEPETDFLKAWRRTVDASGHVKTCAPTFNSQINYYFWGAFGERLQKLFDIFSAEQVLVISLDEINSKPDEVYTTLLNFLQISNDISINFNASNVGYRVKHLRLHQIVLKIKKICSPLLVVFHRFNRGRGTGLLKLLNKYNTEKGTYAVSVSEELRHEIKSVFTKDTQIAKKFLASYPVRENNGIDRFL